MDLKKAARTLQSELAFLKEGKDFFYLWSRRLLRIPHEADFRALRVINERFPGCYVDVGANQGQSIESIRLFAPHARIISFEPNPIAYNRLASRYRNDRKVEVRNVGLTDRCDQQTLHIPAYRGFLYDGLASFDHEAAIAEISSDTIYFFRSNRLSVSTYNCQVMTLDSQGLTLTHPLISP